MNKITAQTVRWYRTRKCTLMPLSHASDGSIALNARGKKPVCEDWGNQRYSDEDIDEYIKQGHNVAWKLGALDLVLDIDPRHDGDVGLARLEDRLSDTLKGRPFREVYPTVISGSGGYHFYMSLDFPTWMDYGCKFRKHPNDRSLDGVELLNKGFFASIPGSYHAKARRYYMWDTASPYKMRRIKRAPTELLDLFRFEVKPATQSGKRPRILNEGQLQEVLSLLPVSEYRDYNEWFGLMCSCYHCTEGEGLDVFLEWSLSDPPYASHGSSITQRWMSLDKPASSTREIGSLIYELKKHVEDYELPAFLRTSSARYDIIYEPVDASDLVASLMQGDKPRSLGGTREQIVCLNEQSTNAELNKALRGIVKLGPEERFDALQTMSDQTGRSLAVLRAAMSAMVMTTRKKRAKKDGKTVKSDYPSIFCKYTMDVLYDKGRELVMARDMRFWRYDKQKWVLAHPGVIKQDVLEAIRTYCDKKNVESIGDTEKILNKTFSLLKTYAASEADFFKATRSPLPVLNCKNTEVWIDQYTGDVTLKNHTPEHYLTSGIDVDYDPSHTCETFDYMLEGVFSPLPDAEDVTRHLWEIIGYVIQPLKDIPIWVMLYGKGNDGKSTILRILTALLGDSALERGISMFNTATNKHAYTPLVGKLLAYDDDLKAGATLPDDILKKTSENKTLTADPKGAAPFAFYNTSTFLISTNHYPYTQDLSHGFRRRTHVIPFLRRFREEEVNTSLERKVIREELSGVINRALAGLQRLRKRGNFLVPKSCQQERDTWLRRANQVTRMIDESLVQDEDGLILFDDFWSSFQSWCIDSGITKRYNRQKVYDVLIDLNYEMKRSKDGIKVIGLRIRK